ncbi:hypothetical protein [uncultured Eubacterium sp.]|uniref:hypothetical protein n=1 Tax=uncultured Eubacterium sp. TaxID=165185 RepID=UPI002594E6C5|nr:hypothetical protein [uncultured Eubacterium sp.]
MKGYKVKDMSMINELKKESYTEHFVEKAEHMIFSEIMFGNHMFETEFRKQMERVVIEALRTAADKIEEKFDNFEKSQDVVKNYEDSENNFADLVKKMHNNINIINDLIDSRYCEEECCEGEKIDEPLKNIKVFISQPMKNKTNDEILEAREDIKTIATKYIHFIYGKKNKIIFIDSFQKDKKGKPLYLLGESLKMLSEADMAFFPINYEEYRGCNIEHKCAKEYGIRVVTYNKGIIE